jgi:aspartyl-tRNA(Asn)/glutamyl-tRNA(Gln) amidotransferase subunit A
VTGTDIELCYLPAAELAKGYAARRFSPVEVVTAFLRRIDAMDSDLHSYITVLRETARSAASDAERRYAAGVPLGPLDGVPIGLKDVIDTAGIRTTANSRHFLDRIPRSDATVVERLRQRGAIVLGKHTMYEFASGTPGPKDPFPAARNPWDPELVPGGSSSGSAAAVAAGLCAGAIGSDTGGSIRGPASYCGVVGFKPSPGLLSTRGVVPLSWTLDHVGPIARTVDDAALLLQAGTTDNTNFSTIGMSIDGLRLGAPISLVEAAQDLDAQTITAYHGAINDFRRRGIAVDEVTVPEYDFVGAVSHTILAAEAFTYHRYRLQRAPSLFGAEFRSRLLQGALLSANDYVTALRGRTLLSRAMTELMRSFDALILPATPHPAWSFAEEMSPDRWRWTSFTRLFNLTRQPAIAIPCGFTSSGLPIGLQIAGRPLEDTTVLALARAYEREHTWYLRHPNDPHAN